MYRTDVQSRPVSLPPAQPSWSRPSQPDLERPALRPFDICDHSRYRSSRAMISYRHTESRRCSRPDDEIATRVTLSAFVPTRRWSCGTDPTVAQHHCAILKLIVVGLRTSTKPWILISGLYSRSVSNFGPERRTRALLRRVVRRSASGSDNLTLVSRWKNSNHTAPADLVKRSENDVAHTGAHFPKERAAIAKE